MSDPRSAPAAVQREPWREGSRWAALAGVVAALTGFAVAGLVAAFVAPAAGPPPAAGAGVVDAVPPWLKDFATATFGTADKAILLVTMVVVIAAGAAFAGVLELRRPPLGAWLVAVVGAIGAVVAAARPGASAVWVLPSALGALTAVVVLRGATRRLRAWRDARRDTDPQAAAMGRRGFLALTGVAAAGALLVAAGARAVTTGTRVVAAARAAVRLPVAARSAVPVPAGADLRLAGLTPYVTPNADFYRIDTALVVPQVDPDTWRLTVTGLVDEPFHLTFADLLALPLMEHHVTLTCVSNEVGGDLAGNALWLGYPVRDLLTRARPRAGADMVLSRSVDGWTASTPLDVLTDPERDCLLAVGMNGEPLPLSHGFPARLVVPGLYGYVSATKWVTELKVTRFSDDVAYWSTRGWSPRGPVKLASRIDVPRQGAGVGDSVVVAGVAWAQHTGIARVEVRVDDGPWHEAALAEAVSADTWRQWSWTWDAADSGPGTHTLTVRATDADGAVQTADVAPPAPDGATGWHQVRVRVG